MLKSAPEEPESTSTSAYTKMEDDFAHLSRQEQRERERRLKSILEARPTEAQLQIVGEPSLKAAKVLGEARLATKSAAGIAFFGDDGHFDSEAVRKANEEWIEEKRRRRAQMHKAVEASLGKPSKAQLDYPQAARKRPVSIKALQLLGDDELAMLAKQQIPDSAMPRPKALKVFGSASDLAPLKARRILGSSEDDGEARALADRQWIEEMARRALDFTKEVIARKPDVSLQSIPLDKGPVAEKALRFFGDEGLRSKSLRALKMKSKVPPKAIHILGEAGLAGHKAEVLCGPPLEDIPERRRPRFSPLLSYRKLFGFAINAS